MARRDREAASKPDTPAHNACPQPASQPHDDVLERPGPGDVIVVWRLDRSLRHLLQLIDDLTDRGSGSKPLR